MADNARYHLWPLAGRHERRMKRRVGARLTTTADYELLCLCYWNRAYMKVTLLPDVICRHKIGLLLPSLGSMKGRMLWQQVNPSRTSERYRAVEDHPLGLFQRRDLRCLFPGGRRYMN